MREQLEQYLLDHPEDATAPLAYADWLEEHDENDRAEFIRVQTALEDESLAGGRRQALAAREQQLLEQYQRQWLGEMAPFLLDNEDSVYGDPERNCTFHFRRGFFRELHISTLGHRLVQAMKRSPLMPWVVELSVQEFVSHHHYANLAEDNGDPIPDDLPENFEADEALQQCPSLSNVRRFRVGEDWDADSGWVDCHCYCRHAAEIVARMPRLEELHLLCKEFDLAKLFSLDTLGHLRVLRIYHLGHRWVPLNHRIHANEKYEYELELLANNPAFRNLTTLRFHPHYRQRAHYPDPSDWRNAIPFSFLPLPKVQALLESPNLPSLSYLQLRLSDMGDEGCRAIVRSGILKRLKVLDLGHGGITDDGARVLASSVDLKNLRRLDVQRNALTRAGIAALEATGVQVIANDQLSPQEVQQRQYLMDGDFE
jgi:uncharacterized protein (TIGR02996 family)